MLSGVEDYPWIDCVTCSVHGDCGKHVGAERAFLEPF
jgi:hypothetical protein